MKRAPVLPVEKLGHLIARLPEPYRTMAVLGTTGMREMVVTPKGTLFRGSDVGKKAFRTAAKGLELPELTWRSFRRSVETLLHAEGVPMKIQQQILGHTKATTTLLYAEPGTEDRREALRKIQSQLLPNVAKLQLELQLGAGK